MKKNGFTIVELLVVIVVIAILASLAIVAFSGIQKRATASVMQTTVVDTAKLFFTQNVGNSNYPSSLPVSTNPPDGIGLSLSEVSSVSDFCINITSSRFDDLMWHVTQALQLEEGSCAGDVIAASIIGDYNTNAAPASTAVVTVNGDGGGLKAQTDEPWNNVTISWDAVAGASRYELQLLPTGSSTWYLRRIAATAANSNASIATYQSDPSFSAQIPPSTTSITWAGNYAMPLTAGGAFQYRIRSYDASSVPGSWNTVSLSAPAESSIATLAGFSVAPDTNWNSINLTWDVPSHNVPSPEIEIQLRDQASSTWYLRRILDAAPNSNAPIASYEVDLDFSAHIPVTTETINWKGIYAVPKDIGKTFEYRIRLRSATVIGLYGAWTTIQLTTPVSSDYPVVAGFSGSATGSGTTSAVNLSWSAPTNPVPGMVYEIQLKDASTSTWYLRRIVDTSSNSNAPVDSYQNDAAFSALTPNTMNSIEWHGIYPTPQAGQTFDYRIRQKSTSVSGLYSGWTTTQVSR